MFQQITQIYLKSRLHRLEQSLALLVKAWKAVSPATAR